MNANDLFQAAMEINLDAIKTKLMHAESGEGWSQEKADAVEKEYRRFLCLMKLYPQESTAPLVDVDTFWHYHILDTMKYAADCEQLFGYFLHHYPYVGLRGEDDEQVRIDSGMRMKELYENTFGEAYPMGAAPADAPAATSYCGGPWPDKAGPAVTGIRLNAAYCGGPWPDKAGKMGKAIDLSTAYCGGPWPDKAGKTARTATAIEVSTAYCGGPWPDKAGKVGKAIDLSTAYCGGPWPDKAGNTVKAAKAIEVSTAYCGGPWPDKAGGVTIEAAATAKPASTLH